MNVTVIRYIPLICILGAAVGFYSYISPWYADGTTGLGYLDSMLQGFEKYIPTIMVALSVVVVVASVTSLVTPRFWFMPFVSLLCGVVILALTSLFSMWSPEGERIVHYAAIGFWLSYGAGTLMIIGAALQYTFLFRKPVNRKGYRA